MSTRWFALALRPHGCDVRMFPHPIIFRKPVRLTSGQIGRAGWPTMRMWKDCLAVTYRRGTSFIVKIRSHAKGAAWSTVWAECLIWVRFRLGDGCSSVSVWGCRAEVSGVNVGLWLESGPYRWPDQTSLTLPQAGVRNSSPERLEPPAWGQRCGMVRMRGRGGSRCLSCATDVSVADIVVWRYAKQFERPM